MISFERILWVDINDVETGTKLRIFGDKNGETIYLEQGSAMIELDPITQGQLAKMLVSKMALELTRMNIPKEINDNL